MTEAGAAAPWEETVRRVVVQDERYLDWDGRPSTGGRERWVRDLLRVVREWGREAIVVQKGRRDFEGRTEDGVPVIGLRSRLDSLGDPAFAWRVRRLLRPGDGVIYASGADAWPFFTPGAKGVQHGIFWDGPHGRLRRELNRRRQLDWVAACRSVLCVDTNYINWLRCQGARGLALAARCTYLPNYADLDRLPAGDPERPPADPPRILFARRYTPKRGPLLFLDALALLAARGVSFRARMFAPGGVEPARREADRRGLSGLVEVDEADLDGILAHALEADLAVVPTVWSEGTSLAAVEALCAGVPVVATPVGGLGNLVIPGFNGFLEPPRAEPLADAIARALEPATWRRLRRGALALRPALGLERWTRSVRAWLAA